MIRYLKNREIDRTLWDECVNQAPGAKPYAMSWYLDIMSPGWEALVDDDYDSVFPLPAKRKYGIHYVATPAFLQQLGAFSPDKPPSEAAFEFLDYIPDHFRLVDLNISQNITHPRYHVTERMNYMLDLTQPYESMFKGFSAACRRDIERSMRRKSEIVCDIRPQQIIDLFIRQKGDAVRGVRHTDFQKLLNLMEHSVKDGTGVISGIRTGRKKIAFAQFYFRMPGYINLFFRVNSEESRMLKLNYFFMNELIREHAGSKTMIDFAGSSIPSVGAFIRSFGPAPDPYCRIYRNTLPWPVRLLK